MAALGDEEVKLEAEEIIAERIKLNPWSIKKIQEQDLKALLHTKNEIDF